MSALFEHGRKEEVRWGELQPLVGYLGVSLFLGNLPNDLYQGTLHPVGFDFPLISDSALEDGRSKWPILFPVRVLKYKLTVCQAL